VGEDGKNATLPRRPRSWIRNLLIAGAALLVVFALFHGPILRPIARRLAIHFAAKENLKLDFQIDGSVLGSLALRNVHAFATGPSAVQSIDADLVRADYSIFGLIFHGMPEFLENVEVRSAAVVIDPGKSLPSKSPKPDEKISLPGFFPDRLRLSNVNLIVRDQPQDLVVRNVNIDLDPRIDGALKIDQLQIPNLHRWTNVSATTSYTNKNLFLRNLTFDEQNKFQVVNVDASRIRSRALGLAVDGSLIGGNIKGTIALREKKSSLATEINFSTEHISLTKLTEYFGRPAGFMTGDVESLKMNWRGLLKNPKSWDGFITARLHDVHQKDLALDAVDLDITTAHGMATVRKAEIIAGNNRVQISGSATLPSSTSEFGWAPADLKLLVHAPNLKQLTGFLTPPITGNAEAKGSIEIKDETAFLKLSVNGNEIGFDKAAAKKLAVAIEASKKMPSRKSKEPYYTNLASTIRAELSDVHYEQYLVDSVRAELSSRGKDVSFHRVAIMRNANELSLKGQYELPPAGTDPLQQPADFNFALNVPQLADYWQPNSPDKIAGTLQGDGQLRAKNAAGSGQLKIYGQNITAKNLLVRQFTTQASMSESTVYLNDLTATLSDKDSVKAQGTFSLRKPHHYSGKVLADIADLSVFKPVLKAAQNQNELAGALKINWEGTGDALAFKNSGVLKLTLEKGRYGDLQSLQANVDANYSPEGLNVPIIFLGSDKMDFQAIAQTTGETLEISKIQIDQGKAKYATGYFSLPFVWKNLGNGRELFPAKGKVNVTFQSENLDLKKLFEDFGTKAPVSGSANVKLDAQGPLADLRAQLNLQMRDLRTENFPDLEPASFDVGAHVENQQLVIAGKLQQAKIQPLEIQAKMPFETARVLEEGKLSDVTPITAKVHLPRSSVNFLRQFVPAVEEIDGDLALDVNVNGTIANPVLSGAGDITINVMRFTNGTLPALRDFKTRLDFNRDTLSFARFAGDLAGGPFTVSGRITFPKLTQPNIDLQLKASSVLVARNDSLTARADGDIRVNGPLQSASVTGNVALTNSQFLKNIDLIPIGLPGRPAPEPPSSHPEFSFPDPPLRDWKFDVAIKTKDPFLLRGNLANGGAIVDLKLGGTGLHPGLQGLVRLENVEATLPFSRLEIAYGYLYFNPDDSLNPKIDLHGTSVIRDYTVHVYVYGPSLSPEAIFTSEPPLPQEEIISLLATGTTRQELTGNNNVLAGRAAMLLVQQLYRKIFKKDGATQSSSVFDRLDVDIGQVDPKTGQQTATARYKINQNFVVIGDLGVAGDFRGMVKYVIRFR
jgi:translocation-and-assembly-module (TAM) inner membrane subunit TamB-like protein